MWTSSEAVPQVRVKSSFAKHLRSAGAQPLRALGWHFQWGIGATAACLTWTFHPSLSLMVSSGNILLRNKVTIVLALK